MLWKLLAWLGVTSTDNRTPGTANGKTPVRYVICSNGDTDCFVAARFKDFEACKRHDKWASMLCGCKEPPVAPDASFLCALQGL